MPKQGRAMVCLTVAATMAASDPYAAALTLADAGPASLVFTHDRSDNGPQSPMSRQQLFTIGTDGAEPIQLTDDGLNRFLPHFSPDGQAIVFTKFFGGGYGSTGAVTDVVVYDRVTGIETRLTEFGNGWQGVWSPDGTRILFGTNDGSSLWMMNADGSAQQRIGGPRGTPDDLAWGDWLWSSDDWIYFVAVQEIDGCRKSRIDRIRPDGSSRTAITDGGPYCTPPGLDAIGDADPGISPDGRTLHSSRGLPTAVPGFPTVTVRHLYRFSTEPYFTGKPEEDLSLGVAADCVAGVPKVSPDGDRVALYLICPAGAGTAGIVTMDGGGSGFTFLTPGFGPDWAPIGLNPVTVPLVP